MKDQRKRLKLETYSVACQYILKVTKDVSFEAADA